MCKLGDSMAITGKSSMDECIARDGRPYGGCAILWKLILKTAARKLKYKHERLCGIMIQISNNCEIMCLNDDTSEDDKFAEYVYVLGEYTHSYNPAYVIYGGDMNTDLAMAIPHAHALRNFILNFNLTVCTDAPEAEVADTYVSPNGFSSRIDHFYYGHGYTGTECAGMFY